MNPRVTELEDLSISVKKALRAYKHMPGIPDGLASAELVMRAKELGIPLSNKPTLQELLKQTQALLQAEILDEFDRRVHEVRPAPHLPLRKS